MGDLNDLQRLVRALEPGVRAAVDDTRRAGYTLAVQYSSGRITGAALGRMDHPFATRDGAPLADPSVINVKSGGFRADWGTDGPHMVSGAISGSIANNSREAPFLVSGTRTMFPRPITDRIVAELQPKFEANVARAFLRAGK